MGRVVELEKYEQRIATAVGRARRRSSAKKGARGAYGRQNSDMSEEELVEEDISTTGAEMAVAKFLNQYWGGHVDVYSKDPDVGRSIQVRSVTKSSHSLIVRADDRDDQLFVLVVRKFPRYLVVGYMSGEEAKQEKWSQDPNGRPAAYFVPPSELEPF